jgi:hypothetical protein
MVEFAIGLPILLAMFIGFIEIGRAILAYTVVGNVAREGTRYAIMTTVIEPAPLPGTPPSGTNPAQPTWWQRCNMGHAGVSLPYTSADFPDCSTWPNIVSTVMSKSPGLDLNTVKIFVSYQNGGSTLEGYNRGAQMKVKVEYTHSILFAKFLRLPDSLSTFTMSSESTMLSQ